MNIKKQILENYLKKHNKLPANLYHYTSIDGLLGIVNSKSIWASNILYLNDKDEFHHTLSLLEKKAGEQFIGRSKSKLKQQIYDLFTIKGILEELEIYVFSLSEEGDLLSQWRGYCPQFGFSIAFDYKQLINAIESNSYNCVLLPCIYDSKTKQQYIDQLFLFLLNSIMKPLIKKENPNEEEFEKLFFEYRENFIHTASSFKTEHFSAEREWRLFIIVNKDGKKVETKYRKGNSMIIPFLDFSFEDHRNGLPINEIIVSPSPNQDISIESTTEFIKSNKIKCEVKGSKIPYRIL